MPREVDLENRQDTRLLAKEIAKAARPGMALLLTGDLGAGKTTLTRYICEELSINPREVTSPTFAVIHEYQGGRLPVAHVDLYRLGEGADIYELGLDEYLERGFFVIIEWAEFMAEMPECPIIRVGLRLSPEGKRQAKIETSGDVSVDFKQLSLSEEKSR